jgi:hypothetical protein
MLLHCSYHSTTHTAQQVSGHTIPSENAWRLKDMPGKVTGDFSIWGQSYFIVNQAESQIFHESSILFPACRKLQNSVTSSP